MIEGLQIEESLAEVEIVHENSLYQMDFKYGFR